MILCIRFWVTNDPPTTMNKGPLKATGLENAMQRVHPYSLQEERKKRGGKRLKVGFGVLSLRFSVKRDHWRVDVPLMAWQQPHKGRAQESKSCAFWRSVVAFCAKRQLGLKEIGKNDALKMQYMVCKPRVLFAAPQCLLSPAECVNALIHPVGSASRALDIMENCAKRVKNTRLFHESDAAITTVVFCILFHIRAIPITPFFDKSPLFVR